MSEIGQMSIMPKSRRIKVNRKIKYPSKSQRRPEKISGLNSDPIRRRCNAIIAPHAAKLNRAASEIWPG